MKERKNATIIIRLTILLLLVACDKEGTTQPSNTLSDGTIEFIADEQGYSFNSDKVYQMSAEWGDEGNLLNQIDLGWSDYQLATPKYVNGDIHDQRIIHLGLIDFDSLATFTEDNWDWSYGPSWSDELSDWNFHEEGFISHVFILKTHSNTFAKLKVLSQDWDNHKITIKYVHQEDGTKNFE